ncbi:MAG: hypothetical protein HGA23_05555 [Bacteroidales bacterium]|nr:hypothetical protein [Bacteroidales bacterium]
MKILKFLNYTLLLLVFVSLIIGSLNQTQSVVAMPGWETDETAVPHYFGPNPNWANSPFTLPDAQVVITGNGTRAEAVATVGANGAITVITVINGGSDYSNANVDIVGAGSGATAKQSPRVEVSGLASVE